MSPKKQVGLTRQAIIKTALRLLDEVGLDGLTVRRLAAELDVQSPALYWHFRNKQELLAGMAEAIQLAEGMGGPRAGESWQDWVARRARKRRRALLAHRDGARLVAGTRPSVATTRLFDQELEAMVGCGFTPVLALRTIISVGHYILGSVLQEQAGSQERADGPSDPLRDLAGQLSGGHSAPLVAAIRDGGDPLGDDAFEHGLRMLIAGVEAELARR